MTRPLRARLLLLAVVAVWGATFVVVKDALRDISPLLFNLLRMVLAAATLAFVYRRDLRRIGRASLAGGAAAGFCLALGYSFQTAGLARTTPVKSAFITGLTVVLVPLLSAVPLLRPPGVSRPRLPAVFGACLAFGGIVLLTTPAGTPARALLTAVNLGDWLTLGCACGFALHVLVLAYLAPRMPLASLAVLQIGFAALFMAASLPVFEQPFLHPSPSLFAAIAVAAFLATAAAFTIQSWAQRYLPATQTALIFALEPVFAWITSFAFMGERLHLRAAAGALLILGGIAWTELWPQATPPPAAHEGVFPAAGA